MLIDYLLSDKTGTLTQNVMEMKEIHMGDISFAREALQDLRAVLKDRCSYRCFSQRSVRICANEAKML